MVLTGYFVSVWNYTFKAIYKVDIFIDMDEPQYSEELTKLMDDVVHRPEEIRMRDAANLSVKELAVYIKFRAKQEDDPGSKLAKHVKKEPSTGPIMDITN